MEETTSKKEEFCEHCGKSKLKNDCIIIDGRTFCCSDCHRRGPLEPKPNTCEFC